MNAAPADSPPPNEDWLARPKPSGAGWTRQKWVFLVALAVALHLVLLFIFGTKKQFVPRATTNVPHLQLADSADELIALGDPTLFALPHANDFSAAVWLKTPAIPPTTNRWTEPPGELPAPEKLGAAFGEFMRTNRFAELPLDFKPEPKLSEATVPFETALPPATTLQIAGSLAQRRLLHQIELPALPCNDVIAPSRVQALVDEAGNVVSVVLLPSDNSLEGAGHYDVADQLALQLARQLRFAPAPQLMFGRIIFNWHTVPVTTNNVP